MRLLTLFSGLLAVSTATAAATPARAAGAAVPVVERQVPDFHRGLDAQDVCRFFFHMSSVSADMYHPAHEISGTNGAQLLDKGIPGEKKGPYGYIINQLVYMMGRMDGFRASLRTTDPFEIPLEEQKIDYCVRGFVDVFVHVVRILTEKAILFRELAFVRDPVAGTLSGFLYTYRAGLSQLLDLIEDQGDKENIIKWTAAMEHHLETAILAYRGVITMGQDSHD